MSGFAGHGINTSAVAGHLIARAVADNDDAWRAFVPFDLVWAGGRLGRVFAETLIFIRNRREEFEAERAQRREREHRAGAEPSAAAAAETKSNKPKELRPS